MNMPKPHYAVLPAVLFGIASSVSLAATLPTPGLQATSTLSPRLDTNATQVLLAQADEEVPTPGKPKKCRPAQGTFTFNADKENIDSLLQRISQLTCKNFIVSESVKGKSDITIISHQPVTVAQAEAAFLAALEANNMALTPAGAYWKVVERKDSVKSNLPIYESADELPSTDAQVTLLYELKYADSNQVQSLIRNLMSKSGDLQLVGGNLLIITDAASNIQRLTKILNKIDVSGSSARMHVVKIVWADAQQISQKLQEIFKAATPKAAGAGAARAARAKARSDGEAGDGGAGEAEDLSIDKIIADERTNKLIVIASEKAFLSLKEVIDLLDVPSDDTSTGTRIFVHALNNTDATKAASTLSSLAQGGQKKAPAQKGGSPQGAGGESAELFEGEVKVTADETTNSLVIVSSPRDYKALKRVIEELDARRPQVFVEAAIMEVGVNKNRSVALDAYTGLPVTIPGLDGAGLGILANEGGKNLVVSSAQALAARSLFERLNTNTLDAAQLGAAVDASTALDSLLGAVAFQGPAVPGSEEIFGFPVPSFGVVLNALATNANVNVLSTPHIMTTDNEKAEISVGQRVPVVRGIAPVGGGAQGGFFGGLQQVAYEDVKLKFTVTPHVNDAGEIRVELEQEVSDLGGSVPVGNGLNQPIILNRTAKTTVVVRDQQTVVLGGLMADRASDSESKIPILGDLPLIGWLFKNWSDSDAKTNLILVLTPYIVRTENDFQKIYERKLKERKEFLDTYYGIASDYNPYIDYDKKSGPFARLSTRVKYELQRVENGGPGLPGDVVITPAAEITPLSADETEDPAAAASAADAAAGDTQQAPADASAADAAADGNQEPAADPSSAGGEE
ncbi:MAG: type II secretion system secretin GspD [Myxococcota bacterium]